MHHSESADDLETRRLVTWLLAPVQIRSLLDIGSGTGRGIRALASELPGTLVCGVEPVAALLKAGAESIADRAAFLLQASGEALPFADRSFDAVVEFGVLHHAPEPSRIVGEMLRVARRAVVLVDSNRFGQGSLAARLLKLLLYKSRLWPAFELVRTRGKRYQFSEGDGLFYSYSVYDSYDQISQWADRVYVLPGLAKHSRGWFHPLLTAPGVILMGFRERPEKESNTRQP